MRSQIIKNLKREVNHVLRKQMPLIERYCMIIFPAVLNAGTARAHWVASIFCCKFENEPEHVQKPGAKIKPPSRQFLKYC
jgi:hypothetical protein